MDALNALIAQHGEVAVGIGIVLVFIAAIIMAVLGMIESAAGGDTCWHNDDPSKCDLCHLEQGRWQ